MAITAEQLTVKVEKHIVLDKPKTDYEVMVYDLLKKRGLGKLVSLPTTELLELPSAEFLFNLSTEAPYTTSFTCTTEDGGEVVTEFNVRDLLIQTFDLPHKGGNIFGITEEQMKPIMELALIEPDRKKPSPYITSNAQLHYKTIIHILHHCILGLTGSLDQILVHHRQFLTALLSDEPWDWPTFCVDELILEWKMAIERSPHQVRNGLKISAMIHKATEGSGFVWNPIPIVSTAYYVQAAKAKRKTASVTEKDDADQPKKKRQAIRKLYAIVPDLPAADSPSADPPAADSPAADLELLISQQLMN